MPHRRLLFLDTTHLTVHAWASGRLHEEASFANAAIGHEDFAEYLAKHRDSNFYLLVDVADEGFQVEHIPHSGGSDRAALLKRRLGQYYYGTPYATAISFGRAKEGRRDEKILLTALTRPEHLAPWMDAMLAAEASLAGIYSVPLVLADWGSRLAADRSQFLLLTLGSGGLRQTFFDNGQMLFSRLSLLATGGRDEVAIAASVESAKIYQYLVGQRLVARGAILHAVVVAPRNQVDSLQAQCRNTEQLVYDFLDLADLAKRSGLRSAAGERADQLLMHQLVTKPPRHQFAAPTLRRYFHFWQLRFGLASTSGIALAACVLFAGKLLLDSAGLVDRIAQTKSNTDQLSQRYATALDALPKVAPNNDNLRALIAQFTQLDKRSPGMRPLLDDLARVLGAHPGIEIVRIDWRIATTLEATSGNATASPPPGTAVPAYSVIDLDAELPVRIGNDLRAQQEAIESFASRFKNDGLAVRMLKLPFDATSAQTLKSSTAAPAAQITAPRFSMRIARSL